MNHAYKKLEDFQSISLQQNQRSEEKTMIIAPGNLRFPGLAVLWLIRLLPVVGQPFAITQFHIGKDRFKGRILGRAGIDTKADLASRLPHVAHTHLGEDFAICGTFDAVIVLPTAEAIPHSFDGSVNGGGCPIGVTVVGDHAAQMLKAIVFVFNRTLQPVVAIQVHDDAALVETVMAFLKRGLHRSAEELFFRFHLEYRSIVITEMVVGSLPQISVGVGDNFHLIIGNHKGRRLPDPPEILEV